MKSTKLFSCITSCVPWVEFQIANAIARQSCLSFRMRSWSSHSCSEKEFSKDAITKDIRKKMPSSTMRAKNRMYSRVISSA